MRRVAMFSFAMLLAMTALAEDLLDCLTPEVRMMLLQAQGQRAPVLTSLVPAELSALKMPDDFTWIGASERPQGGTNLVTNLLRVTAAWRSTLPEDAARAAATAALTAAGWEVRSFNSIGAFTTPATPQLTACREGNPISVSVISMEGVTYALMVIQRDSSNSSCPVPGRVRALVESAMDGIVPTLMLPADPSTGAPASQTDGQGAISNGAILLSHVQFSVGAPIDGVASHFAKQMTDQGWSSDAMWAAKATAGSVWLKRTETNTEFVGTLSLSEIADGRYMATLRVHRLQ